MRVHLYDLPYKELCKIIFETWSGYFPNAGRVVEVIIDATSTLKAQFIYETWKNRNKSPDVLIDYTDQFPNLISLAIHSPVSANVGGNEQLSKDFENFFLDSAKLDENAHVVGQSFCAYALPNFGNTKSVLKSISGALDEFRNIPFMGNLGHPPSGGTENLREFDVPKDWNIPDTEKYFWDSDLSVNEIRLEFLAGHDFDASLEMEAVGETLGRSWDHGQSGPKGIVQWIRKVKGGGEEAGKELLSFLGKHNGRYCLTSFKASEYFGLNQAPQAFSLETQTNNKLWLSPFSLESDFSQKDEIGSKIFEWTLPARPCYDKLLSVGISFAAK